MKSRKLIAFVMMSSLFLLLIGCGSMGDPLTTEYNLTLDVNGSGNVTTKPTGTKFEEGTIVSLSPVAEDGWVFDSWSGSNGNEVSENAIKMNDHKHVVANFKEETTDGGTDNDGNVTVSLSLPYKAEGKEYMIMFDDNNNPDDGGVVYSQGTCGSNALVEHTLAVPAGEYYIQTFVDVDGSGFDQGPTNGDYVGMHGAESAEPTSPTAIVEEGEQYDFGITLDVMDDSDDSSSNMTIELSVDQHLTGKEYLINFEDIADGTTYDFTGTCEATKWITHEFDIPVGEYHITAIIDIDGDGVDSAPDNGDYFGELTNKYIDDGSYTVLDMYPMKDPNVSITLNLPQSFDGSEYIIVFDYDTDPNNDNEVFEFSDIAGTNNLVTVDLAVGPGDYYVYAALDANNNGLEYGPDEGDYCGIFGGSQSDMPTEPNVTVSDTTMNSYDIQMELFDTSSMPAEHSVDIELLLPSEAYIYDYRIIIDNDMDQENGIAGEIWYQPDMTTNKITDDIIMPEGEYYIYAEVDITGNYLSNSGASYGDFVGVYDGTFDTPPTQPTAIVSSTSNNVFTLDMEELLEQSVKIYLHLPEYCDGEAYQIIADDDQDLSNGYVKEIRGESYSDLVEAYMYLPPGTYNFTALVDANGTGLDYGPDTGDYYSQEIDMIVDEYNPLYFEMILSVY